MKQYVWKYQNPITTEWHSGGGLMIITNGSYQELWNKYFHDNGLEGLATLDEPDFVWNVDATEERIIVFPDVGCC